MIQSTGTSPKQALTRLAVVLLSASLVSGGQISPSSAFAATVDRPTISFDGNSLATSAPKDELVDRPNGSLLAVTNGPLSRVVTTTRQGYTFGGWSFEKGGPAVTQLATARTSDTFRLIFAVWNTTIRYNHNRADSGALTNFKTQDLYRFGQTLALPTVGTLVKSGFEFGGWMSAPYSPTRISSYTSAASDVGNLTMYASWIKTVSYNANGATGTPPASTVYTSGGPKLRLPSFTETTLRKPGHNLAGWSTSPMGSVVDNPRAFVPLLGQNTLYAIWKVQGTSATSEISFKPGKSNLSARQRVALDTLASSIGRGSEVKVTVASVRASGTSKALGKARNRAVVRYLNSAGINASFTRSNNVGTSGAAANPRNNAVSVQASWINPAN